MNDESDKQSVPHPLKSTGCLVNLTAWCAIYVASFFVLAGGVIDLPDSVEGVIWLFYLPIIWLLIALGFLPNC